MDITPDIKEFLRHAGKALVLEDGAPSFVITDFSEYMELVRHARGRETTVGDVLDLQQFCASQETAYAAENPSEGESGAINRELEALAKDDFFARG